MPFSRVPGEAFNENGLKNPKEGGFWGGGEIFGHLERGSMLFLDKEFDQVVAFGKEGHLLRVHDFDEVLGGNLAVFYRLHHVGGDSDHSVYLGEGGVGSCNPTTNPITDLEATGKGCWVLRDAGYDGVFVCSVDDMRVYLECREAHPLSIFLIPFGLGDGSPFTESAHF